MKEALRKSIIAGRDALSIDARRDCSERITQRLQSLECYREAEVVLGYMNFGSEYHAEEFAAGVLSAGKILILPRLKKDRSGLDLYHVSDLRGELEPGVWGIREPRVDCERVEDIARIDFVLVPGVAFGMKGERLGYGGGFYDRLLAGGKRAHLVAGAYALQIAENIPVEEYDVPVDIVVTENGEYFRRKGEK